MTTNAILYVPLAGSEPLKSGSKARRPRQQLHDLMRKALEGHWVVAKKEYGVSLDSRTVLGKHTGVIRPIIQSVFAVPCEHNRCW